MDDNDPLLAHQIEAVRALAAHFEAVWVISNHRGSGEVPRNVFVKSLDWQSNRDFKNIARFLRLVIPLILKKEVVIFSHMTDVQAAVISPLTKILKKRHIQWYAHKTYSPYLKFSKLFVDGIVTSTEGSCPVSGTKVHPIGQAIIPASFPFNPKIKNSLDKAVHIGRFDPSKNLKLLAQCCVSLSHSFPNISFTQIGNSTTAKANQYSNEFALEFADAISARQIILKDSIPRSHISEVLMKYDFFIHGYEGSLDKSLLEATLCGIPVLTLNPEFLKEFGSWSGLDNPSLIDEFMALKDLNSDERLKVLEIRRARSENNHSLKNWTRNLLNNLSED